MVDYTKVTKDGYEVKKLYRVKQNAQANPFLIAVIFRPTRGTYMWAWDYNPRDGSWGQGHYDFELMSDAVKNLKKAYYKAELISSPGLVWLKSDYMHRDGFGWYTLTDRKGLFADAYKIAKSRNDVIVLESPTGKKLGEVRYSKMSNKAFYFAPKSTTPCRIFADGRMEY